MSHGRKVTARIARPLLMAALLPVGISPAMAATQWGSYQWEMPRDFAANPIQIHESYESSTDPGAGEDPWTTYVGQAATDWSKSDSPVRMTFDDTPPAVNNLRKCTPPSGKVEVCNYTYGFNGWLGVAQIWTSGDYIVQGSVKLNDSYFNSSTYNTAGWKLLVTCQEVGHTIGLSHDDTTFGDPNYGTCMDYTSDPDAAGSYVYSGLTVTTNGSGGSEPVGNHRPNLNDYGLLSCMYDGSNTACANAANFLNSGPPPSSSGGGGSGGGTGGGGNGRGHGKHLGSGPTDFGIRFPGQTPPVDFPAFDAGNSPAEWGKAVALTADGRGRVFEHEVAPGRKIITEVFWAPH